MTTYDTTIERYDDKVLRRTWEDIETSADGKPMYRARVEGKRIRVTRLDADGRPVGEPEDLVGTRWAMEIGPEGGDEAEPVDLLWEEWDGGMSEQLRGSSAIRALMIVLGWNVEGARAALQTEMNRRLIEARGKDRVYASVVKKYSGNVWSGVPREVMETVLAEAGWVWVPTMQVGTGTQVHVRYQELPEEALADRAVLRCSADEYVAVVAGVVRHPSDPSRGGTRAVYGYFCQAEVREVFAQDGGAP